MRLIFITLIVIILSSCQGQPQTQTNKFIKCLNAGLTNDYSEQITNLEKFFIEKGLLYDVTRQSYEDLISNTLANPSDRKKIASILNGYRKEIPKLSDTFVMEYCCEEVGLNQRQEICTLLSRISKNGLTLSAIKDLCQKWTKKEFDNQIVIRGTILLLIWYDILYQETDGKE